MYKILFRYRRKEKKSIKEEEMKAYKKEGEEINKKFKEEEMEVRKRYNKNFKKNNTFYNYNNTDEFNEMGNFTLNDDDEDDKK